MQFPTANKLTIDNDRSVTAPLVRQTTTTCCLSTQSPDRAIGNEFI